MDVAITIDIERLYENAEQGTYRFLTLLKEYDIKATFFITGDVMRNCPQIVEEVAIDEHEVASHGYTHPGHTDRFQLPYLTDLEIEEARYEIERSKQVFEEAGHRVYGFRSPGFRINRTLQRLIGQYFRYDSSIINCVFPGIKYKRASRVPKKMRNVIEVPVSNLNAVRLPLGSPYFLCLGAPLLTKCLDLIGTSSPIVFYFHCFDLVKLRHESLPHSWLKKKYYFDQCGPENIRFFKTLFLYFKNRSAIFKTCREISEDLTKI